MSNILSNGVFCRKIVRNLDHESKLNLRFVDQNYSGILHSITRKLRLNHVELTFLQKFSCLTDIDCSFTPVTNNIVKQFPPSLETLNISHCEHIIGHLNLSAFVNLKKVTCQHTNVVNTTFDTLPSTLMELDVSCSWGLRNPDLSRFVKLEKLEMLDCSDIEMNALRLSGLTNLREIYCNATQSDKFTIENIPPSAEVLVIPTRAPLQSTNIDLSGHARLRILECKLMWNLGTGDRLPPGLEELDILSIDRPCEFEILRFQGLKKFKCEFSRMEHVNRTTVPSSVETLSLGKTFYINFDTFDLTKNGNLKELVWDSQSRMNDGTLERLPSSLEKLTIWTNLMLHPRYSRLTNLRELIWNTDYILQVSPNLLPRSLELLHIRNSDIAFMDLFDLTEHDRLRDLDCSGTRLTNKEIYKLPLSLEKLNIEMCPRLSDLDLSKFTNLRILVCNGIDMRIVSVNTLPLSLESLEMSRMHNINPDKFDLSHHISLKDLDCSYAAALNSASMKKLPISLEKLNLTGCQRVRELDLLKLTRLKHLNCSLTNVMEVTSNTLPLSLIELKFRWCPNVCIDSIDLSRHTQLRILDCNNVFWSDTAVEKLPISLRNGFTEPWWLDIFGPSMFLGDIGDEYTEFNSS